MSIQTISVIRAAMGRWTGGIPNVFMDLRRVCGRGRPRPPDASPYSRDVGWRNHWTIRCSVSRLTQPLPDAISVVITGSMTSNIAGWCATCQRKITCPHIAGATDLDLLHGHDIALHAAKFWSLVHRTDDGCWLWTAGKNRLGYGRVRLGLRVLCSHRASWLFTYGPIVKGLVVCHGCDNPTCVRTGPGHLFLGTQGDNIRDARDKGRLNKLPNWTGVRNEDRR